MLPTPDLCIPPREWEQLRALIAAACGPAVLVGGALRDLDNGREVKDLDFFVLVPPVLRATFSSDEQARHLRATIPGLEVVEQLHTGYCDFRDEVFHVLSCRVPDVPQAIQVIFADLETPEQAITRVDFGLCQIGWDGDRITRTLAYLQDREAQTFTLYAAPSQHHHDRSRRRFDRFLTKYPGWTFVDRSGLLLEF